MRHVARRGGVSTDEALRRVSPRRRRERRRMERERGRAPEHRAELDQRCQARSRSGQRCSGARPLSRSLRLRSRRLRGDTRRNASSPGYRLLALRRVSPRIRRTASLHVAQFGTRPLVPCLTFHKVRFLRSFCARRRSVSSLNLAATHPHPA